MESLQRSFTRNIGTISLVLALAVSLGFNVYLARRGSSVVPRSPQIIKLNTRLPSSLPVKDIAGNPASLSFTDDSRATVLYVFSPFCGWCKRNEANIKELASRAGNRFRFLGLSLEQRDLQKYVAEGHAPFPVYLANSEEVMRQLNLYGTPEVIVVDTNAKVQRVWQGAFVGETQKEVQDFFGLQLPGLSFASGSKP